MVGRADVEHGIRAEGFDDRRRVDRGDVDFGIQGAEHRRRPAELDGDHVERIRLPLDIEEARDELACDPGAVLDDLERERRVEAGLGVPARSKRLG